MWIIGCLFLVSYNSFGQQSLGEVNGTVVDKKNRDVLIEARVFIKDQDRIYQTKTDSDGNFRISAIPAGKYDLNITYLGDTLIVSPISVTMDGICRLGTVEFTTALELGVVTVTPGIRLIDGDLPVRKITQEDIKNSPVKFDPKALIVATNSDVRLSPDGDLMFRGARKGDMLYLVDGIKLRNAEAIPSCAINSIIVYTGGMPAKYGDTNGGVVVMESKGYFDLLREYNAR